MQYKSTKICNLCRDFSIILIFSFMNKRTFLSLVAVAICSSGCGGGTEAAIHSGLAETGLRMGNFAQKIVSLSTVEPNGYTSDLEGLSPFLRDRLVIGLGEATHGTSEFYKIRHRIFQYAVANWGHKILALEVHFGVGAFLDDYIRTGQGDLTQILKNSGYWIYTNPDFAALVEWIKNYNVGKTEAERLKIYGFDTQAQGAANSVVRLRAYLEQSKPAYVAKYDELTSFITQGFSELNEVFKLPQDQQLVAGEEVFRQYHARLQEVIDYLIANQSDLVSRSGDRHYQVGLQHARVLLMGVIQARLSYTEPVGAMNYRDARMAETVDWISKYHVNQKITAFAHNGHIQKEQLQDYTGLGVNLKNLYSDSYYALGFTFHEGTFAVSAPGNKRAMFKVNPHPESNLTAAFSALKQPLFFMDIASLSQDGYLKGLLDTNYFFYNVGATTEKLGSAQNLSRRYDGVIHVEKTNPTVGL